MQWDELFSHVVAYDPAEPAALSLPTGGGVYLLTDEQDRLVQLASAADLRRAVMNRLGISPNKETTAEKEGTEAGTPAPTTGPEREDAETREAETAGPAAPPGRLEGREPESRSTRRADLSQIVRHVRWQPTHSVFEATYEYHRIARVVLPDTYLKNIAFGPAWFVQVDAGAEVPRFAVGKSITPASGVTLGPFATQQDANRFVQILEDAFDLCRHLPILEQAPHGQPCAYFEMGRCPAPCNASIPMSQYRETVARAVRFATGERDDTRAEWQRQMREAAGGLEFERAAAIKQRIDRAQEIEHPAFRFVRPIQAFSWLIVQRDAGTTRVKPFFVLAGAIEPGEPVRLKDLDAAVARWHERMRKPAPPAAQDSTQARPAPTIQNGPAGGAGSGLLSEHIWLVSHFLFRRERTGLFLDAAALPEPGALAETIRACFAPAPAGKKDTEGPASMGPPTG